MSAKAAVGWLAKLKFTGTHAAIAADIVPEIAQRLHFMGKVGLDYLALEPLGENAQRRRIAAHPARRAARLESARRALCAR